MKNILINKKEVAPYIIKFYDNNDLESVKNFEIA